MMLASTKPQTAVGPVDISSMCRPDGKRVDANAEHTPSRMRNETDLLYYRTPMGGRGPKLLWLLCAEFSESSRALAPLLPLPALALALPVRLRTCGRDLGG